MSNEKQRMESRSIRLSPSILTELKKLADKNGLGITVYMREILERHVETENFLNQIKSGVTFEQ